MKTFGSPGETVIHSAATEELPGKNTSVNKRLKRKTETFVVLDDGVRLSDIRKKQKKYRSIGRAKKLENLLSNGTIMRRFVESENSESEVRDTESFEEFLSRNKHLHLQSRVPGSKIEALNSDDSQTEGANAFKWIIHPESVDNFFSKYWEKEALLIRRSCREYYRGLFSTAELDSILRKQHVEFTKNLDVTSYVNGLRETHSPEGRALPSVVWDFYNNGCSIRMLNPQTFHRNTWKVLATLQEYFFSFCGANVYLTPPGTQGFAPHWDDIEAFVLQLEGKKRWRVYKPRNKYEELAPYSSANLSQEELGTPIIDTILESGDLLYFPRGFIHQAEAFPEVHSLHITISMYQKYSWADYLQKLLPLALADASRECRLFREGLPRGAPSYVGSAYADSEDRQKFTKKVKELVIKMVDYLSVDSAMDQLAKKCIHTALPPCLSTSELVCTSVCGGEQWCPKQMRPINCVELQPNHYVRLLRKNSVRLVHEEGKINLYYSTDNSREYEAHDVQYMEIEDSCVSGVNVLINSYPDYVAIESLPLENLEAKMSLAMGLWEKGLLLTSHPLEPSYD